MAAGHRDDGGLGAGRPDHPGDRGQQRGPARPGRPGHERVLAVVQHAAPPAPSVASATPDRDGPRVAADPYRGDEVGRVDLARAARRSPPVVAPAPGRRPSRPGRRPRHRARSAGRATCTSWVRSATTRPPWSEIGAGRPARSPSGGQSSGVGRPEQPPLPGQRLHRTGHRARPVGRRPRCASRPRVRRRTPARGPPTRRAGCPPTRPGRRPRPSSTTTIRGRAAPPAQSGPARRRSSSARSHRTSRAWRSRSAGATTEPTWGSAASAASSPAPMSSTCTWRSSGRSPAGQGEHERRRTRSWCRCPGCRASSRLPSAGTQPTGYRVCASGSSARATGTDHARCAEGHALVGCGRRQRVEVDLGRQRVRPRPPGRRASRPAVRLHRGVDEPLEVGDRTRSREAVGAGRPRCRAAARTGTGGPPPARDRPSRRPVAERGLEGLDLAGPEPDEGPARLVRVRCAAASGRSITSVESAASCTRRAMRRFVFARMFSLTAPRRSLGGQHEVDTEAATALGHPDEGLDEVGQLGLERGELVDHHDEPRAAADAGWDGGGSSVRSAAPAARRVRSRWRSSASRQRSARCARCASRSVTSPTVWGSPAHRSKALPPLKSTSTKVTWSGEHAAASPATSVRSSSLLPAPVVPATSACGPSRTRSTASTPSSATPSGASRSGSAPAAAHRASRPSGWAGRDPAAGAGRRPGQAGAGHLQLRVVEPRQRTSGPARRGVGDPGGQHVVDHLATTDPVDRAVPSPSRSSTTVEQRAGRRSSVAATTIPATAGPAEQGPRRRPPALGHGLVVEHDEARRVGVLVEHAPGRVGRRSRGQR